jgi:glycyl-tRNA synthetase
VSTHREDSAGGEKRTYFAFPAHIAPVKVSVLPLVKNKPEIMETSKRVFATLQRVFNCEFDSAGAIGRRYRRADEIGTPFCVTVDFESLTDNSVTVRYRDSMEQRRVKFSDLVGLLRAEIDAASGLIL